MASKVIAYGIKVNGLDKAVGSYGELLDLIKESREELKNADPSDTVGSRKALERYAAAKEAQKQFNATVRETQKTLAAAADETGSYRALQNTMSVLKRDFKELSREDRQGEIGKQLGKRIREISDELKEADAELGDYFRNVGDYQNSIFNAFSQLNLGGIAGGDLGSITTLPGIIKDTDLGLQGLTQQAKLFGPALALGAVVQGAQLFLDTVRQAVEETRNAKQLLSVTGGVGDAALNRTTGTLIATTKVFGESQERIFESANALAKQFNVTLEESTELLARAGIATGPLNDELLDISREYGTFFQEIGVDLDRFLALASTQIRDGVFSDKGIDAIKEAAISLREMPQATEDAIAALGIDSNTAAAIRSTDGVLGLLNEVIVRFNELDPESKEAGQVLADVFRGAGEDAGIDYIRNLDLTSLSLEKVTDRSNKYIQQAERQFEQNKQIAESQAEITAQVEDAVVAFDQFKAGLKNESLLLFRDLFQVGKAFKEVIEDANSGLQEMGAFGDVLAEALKIAFAPGIFFVETLRTAARELGIIKDLAKETEGSSVFGLELFNEPQQRSIPGEGFGVLAPRSVGSTEATSKSVEESATKAQKAATEAKKELTGLRKIQQEIVEINREIAGFTGEQAALTALEAEAAQLSNLERLMREEGLRLVKAAQDTLPKVDQELDSLYQSLAAPGADYADIFSQIIEANKERALIVQRLTATQEGLATPDQLRELNDQLERFNRPTQGLTPIGQRETGFVGSNTNNPLAELGKQARKDQAEDATEFANKQIEQARAIEEAYTATANAAQRAFAEFFQNSERDGEAFARAVTQTFLDGLDQQIQALAFKAFAQLAASGPGGAIAGAALSTAILVGWEGIKASFTQFAEGGVIDGPSHQHGGVKYPRMGVELEGGEGVMAKRAMRNPRRFTVSGTTAQIGDYLNRAAGGRGWLPRPGLMQDGGVVPLGAQASLNQRAQTVTLTDNDIDRLASRIASSSGDAVRSGARQGIVDAETQKTLQQPIAV